MNTLFSSITALLPDGTTKTTDVCVSGDTILSVGELPESFKPDTVINGSGKLLIPGLVNAHTHVYMTMFRSCADDLPFTDWLFGHIDPLESKMTREDCYWATLLGYMEMLSTGTTSSLDMYVFTESASRAAEESGVRAVLSRGLTGGASDVDGGIRRIREATEEISAWRNRCSRISFFLGPHAPYSCDPGYLREVRALSDQLGLPMHIHLSEGTSEQEGIASQYGCTPAEYLDRAGILKPGTLAAHCVHLNDDDIRLLAERGVSVVTNPISNLKLGNGIAPVPKMLKAGINVAIGTDGAASNNSLNLFRDLSYVCLLHKGAGMDPTLVSAAEGLRMATENGAAALGLEKVGRIESGWKADLSVLNIDKPWLRPWVDVPSSLCYGATGTETESVMVDGRFLMKNGEYLTIDRERVLYEVDAVCRRMELI